MSRPSKGQKICALGEAPPDNPQPENAGMGRFRQRALHVGTQTLEARCGRLRAGIVYADVAGKRAIDHTGSCPISEASRRSDQLLPAGHRTESRYPQTCPTPRFHVHPPFWSTKDILKSRLNSNWSSAHYPLRFANITPPHITQTVAITYRRILVVNKCAT